MIETQQTVAIAVSIDGVWNYAKDMERWASIMPGYQSCEILGEDDSRWILKVGVGAMVRTVKVRVHVEEWTGPERVLFTFALEGDPVKGGGSYHASPAGPGSTDVVLDVRVEGSGPMAPMWEALGAPVLPKFAKSFAEELKAKIEEAAGGPPADTPAPTETGDRPPALSPWARLVRWLRALFGS